MPWIVLVAVAPTYSVSKTESLVVEAWPLREARPVSVSAPVLVREENVPAPAVKASAPISMAPKAEEMEPEESVPTVFKPAADVMAEESEVASRTRALLMRRTPFVGRLILPEERVRPPEKVEVAESPAMVVLEVRPMNRPSREEKAVDEA